jgi:hypothetical protein
MSTRSVIYTESEKTNYRKYKEETGSAQALEKWFVEEQWWIDNKKDII